MPASRRRRFAAACLATACAVGAVAQPRSPVTAPAVPPPPQRASARRCRLSRRSPTGCRSGSARSGASACGAMTRARARRRARSTPTCCSSIRPPRGRAITAPARNDRRARAARALPDRPGDLADARRRDPRAGPGWAPARQPSQHVVFEAEVAEGLAAAYAARRAIGLDARTVALIRRQLARVAASPDWRWPALVHEPAQLVRHRPRRRRDRQRHGPDARRPLARHLARFTAEASSRGDVPGTSAPGLRFHYQPARLPHARMNFDSPEYANIVLGFSRVYGQARAAGMPPPRALGLLRDWVRRVLSRLLDARRLPELGHRAGLLALAPAQEGRRWRRAR